MFDLITLGVLGVVGIGGGVALLGLAFVYSRDEICETRPAWDGPSFGEAISDHLALKNRKASRHPEPATVASYGARAAPLRARGADESQSSRTRRAA